MSHVLCATPYNASCMSSKNGGIIATRYVAWFEDGDHDFRPWCSLICVPIVYRETDGKGQGSQSARLREEVGTGGPLYSTRLRTSESNNVTCPNGKCHERHNADLFPAMSLAVVNNGKLG